MAEEKTGITLKTIIILMVVMVVIAGLSSYVIMSLLVNDGQQTADDDPEKDEHIGPYYDLGSFIVNLSGSKGYQIIKTGIQVEVDEKQVISELEERMPQIQDIIIMTLRDQKIDDIEQSGAKLIKNQIKVKLNEVLAKGQITEVYFTEFVVQ